MELVALVARDAKERVLFGRRGEGGTFARMWEPPTAPRGEGDPARAHFVKARGVREVGRVEHVLSHRRLDVVVLAAASATTPPPGAGGYERFEWVRLERASELALASFARKVLAAAGCGSMARTSR
jgi:A/G-specific adenine glycosylase